jgi:hypothetical protein
MRTIICRLAARLALSAGFCLVVALATVPARSADLDQNDISHITAVTDAIRSLADDVSRTMHDLPPGDAEQIEAFSYVELNLESAQERLNSVFLLVAVSMYMETATDEGQILNLMSRQILPPSRTFLRQKSDAIASMAVSHPGNREIADLTMRASALLRDRAIPMLDELARKIGAPPL